MFGGANPVLVVVAFLLLGILILMMKQNKKRG